MFLTCFKLIKMSIKSVIYSHSTLVNKKFILIYVWKNLNEIIIRELIINIYNNIVFEKGTGQYETRFISRALAAQHFKPISRALVGVSW